MFNAVNGSDEVEAQSKPFSTIAIPLTQNTKHFQFTEYMLNHNPFPRQTLVALFFSLCQSMVFRFLEGCGAVLMKFRQTLIASIRQNTKIFKELTGIIFEQLEVMFASMTK